MELESNFDFLSHGAIRIKGTRIGIEIILDDYLNGHSPEEIAVRYRNLTLKQVYAAITYYLFNQEKMDAYFDEWRRGFEEAWLEQCRNPLLGSNVCLKSKQDVRLVRRQYDESDSLLCG